jgi:two-component system phosphate regulon sensor histidine kinase PhoR
MGAWGTIERFESMSGEARPWEAGTRSRSVWVWQLALGAVAAIIVVTAAVLDPTVLAIVPVAIGMTGIFVTTIAALLIPWNSLPRSAVSALPYLDIVWIGFLTFSTELRLSHLWVFPIAWLATQFALPELAAGLSVVAVITLVEVLVNETSRASALRVLIALLALTFVGFTVNGTARQAGAYYILLRRQARRTTETLAQVSIEKRRVSETMDDVNIGIARVGDDGALLSANAAYRSLYALDAADPAEPAHSVEYESLRGAPVRARDLTLTRASRRETLTDERVWLYRPDGRWHALAVTTRPQAPRHGEEPSTILIVRDITDVLHAERRRDALAAVVSHEMRNPLTAVLGQADRILERDDLDADLRRRVQIIEESGERMIRLVSTILDARPEQVEQGERTARALVDLRAVLDASIDSFETHANTNRIALALRPGENLSVWADEFRLRQVIDNLVSNALKYTPSGGTVTLSARRDGEFAEIVIADTGMGITAAELPRIYEDFFRSKAVRESGIPGTGLGMSIARTIVEEHGGSIDVKSEAGVGTTVTTRIPLEAI